MMRRTPAVPVAAVSAKLPLAQRCAEDSAGHRARSRSRSRSERLSPSPMAPEQEPVPPGLNFGKLEDIFLTVPQ